MSDKNLWTLVVVCAFAFLVWLITTPPHDHGGEP